MSRFYTFVKKIYTTINVYPKIGTNNKSVYNIFFGKDRYISTMEDFREFLLSSKSTFKVNNFNKIHIVLGNESCDLDSMFSALLLAYFINSKKSADELILPVMNVPESDFPFRTENNYMLQQANVPLDLLVFRDQIDFDKVIKEKVVRTTIVDHHILTLNDKALGDTVIHVYDHRPIDPGMPWNKEKVKVQIQPVGSCATLIAQEILNNDEKLLCEELAFFLYGTIVYDTVALRPENGRAKDLDIKIAKSLEEKFKFKQDTETTFNILRKAHMDVSHLTSAQILTKDLKVIENIPVPGLPMLAADFFKKDDCYSALETFSKSYEKSPIVVVIGLDCTDQTAVKRDVAIYWNKENNLKDKLISKLKNAQELKGYNFELEEIASQQDNIICFRQKNIKLSRKQIVPLIKESACEYFNICANSV